MKLQSIEYQFILLTPAMIGGANGKAGHAEMRVASIRGQVRWWHRFARVMPLCNQVWGQTEPEVIASKVSLTLLPRCLPVRKGTPILPHDLAKSGHPRDALSSGETFTLILRRLVGCDSSQWAAAQNAVKLWLLLGGLGLRVNRAAGSVWPLDGHLPEADRWVPDTESALRNLLATLGYSKVVQLVDASILDHPKLVHEKSDALKLRHAASDTVSVLAYFGGIQPRRVPSPLKMKVIRLGDEHRLLLTGSLTADKFISARNALGAGKPLGSVAWV